MLSVCQKETGAHLWTSRAGTWPDVKCHCATVAEWSWARAPASAGKGRKGNRTMVAGARLALPALTRASPHVGAILTRGSLSDCTG